MIWSEEESRWEVEVKRKELNLNGRRRFLHFKHNRRSELIITIVSNDDSARIFGLFLEDVMR